MRLSYTPACAVSALAAAVLTACSSAGVQGSSAYGFNPLALTHGPAEPFIGVKSIGRVYPDHRKSWVSPDAKRARRLFFASETDRGDVFIFKLPGMQLEGTLTGLDRPQGECSDKQGNVYVAESSNILKYSRTGTLLATYNDTYGAPVGCAVNPLNGDLVVTNLWGTSGPSSPGQMLIYSSPSSSPTLLTNPSQPYYYFAGYDSKGQLWEDGRDPSGAFMLSKCGASSCSTINITGGTIYFPGSVQWVKSQHTWIVFDQKCDDADEACSYTVSASGKLGPPIYYWNYSGGAVCDLVQGTIAPEGTYVVGGDAECGTIVTSSTFDRWNYPAGHNPTVYVSKIASTYVLGPTGSAISAMNATK